MANKLTVKLTALNKDNLPRVRSFQLQRDNPTMLIGRATKSKSKNFHSSDDNLWIPSPVMSRDHAEVYCASDGSTLVIRDRGSLHGTKVNGTKLKKKIPVELKDRDTIEFGAPVKSEGKWYNSCRFDIEINRSLEHVPVVTRHYSSNQYENSIRVPEDSEDDSQGENCANDSGAKFIEMVSTFGNSTNKPRPIKEASTIYNVLNPEDDNIAIYRDVVTAACDTDSLAVYGTPTNEVASDKLVAHSFSHTTPAEPLDFENKIESAEGTVAKAGDKDEGEADRATYDRVCDSVPRTPRRHLTPAPFSSIEPSDYEIASAQEEARGARHMVEYDMADEFQTRQHSHTHDEDLLAYRKYTAPAGPERPRGEIETAQTLIDLIESDDTSITSTGTKYACSDLNSSDGSVSGKQTGMEYSAFEDGAMSEQKDDSSNGENFEDSDNCDDDETDIVDASSDLSLRIAAKKVEIRDCIQQIKLDPYFSKQPSLDFISMQSCGSGTNNLLELEGEIDEFDDDFDEDDYLADEQSKSQGFQKFDDDIEYSSKEKSVFDHETHGESAISILPPGNPTNFSSFVNPLKTFAAEKPVKSLEGGPTKKFSMEGTGIDIVVPLEVMQACEHKDAAFSSEQMADIVPMQVCRAMTLSEMATTESAVTKTIDNICEDTPGTTSEISKTVSEAILPMLSDQQLDFARQRKHVTPESKCFILKATHEDDLFDNRQQDVDHSVLIMTGSDRNGADHSAPSQPHVHWNDSGSVDLDVSQVESSSRDARSLWQSKTTGSLLQPSPLVQQDISKQDLPVQPFAAAQSGFTTQAQRILQANALDSLLGKRKYSEISELAVSEDQVVSDPSTISATTYRTTRPVKRPRKLFDAFKYAAIGATIGAGAIFSALVVTAPDFT